MNQTTQICVPLMVEDHSETLRDATLAAEFGADMVEFRVDVYFEDHSDDEKGTVEQLQDRIDRVLDLVEVSPLPCIVTCRPHWEGGEYHGDDDERVALFEALGTSDSPPAYIDVELATYTRSKNIRQKINLAVNHPKQVRAVTTRLILSMHDFEGRPSDLTRKILEMQDEPACSVVKIAYRARSIRDNLELFEILADRQKPTIALCMGEFGLMSRVLAPKFGGFLTFASLRDESTTAPGQTTLAELLGLYRFRSITSTTKVYGIIGWPVAQSMSPMAHNAGFETIGWDGVYVPMPVEGSYESFKATVLAMIDSTLNFTGASVTIPHKGHAANLVQEQGWFDGNLSPWPPGAINTLIAKNGSPMDMSSGNTDVDAIHDLILDAQNDAEWPICTVVINGAGGVARAAVAGAWPEDTCVIARSPEKAKKLVNEMTDSMPDSSRRRENWLQSIASLDEVQSNRRIYINCTPVGMTDGPDPDGLSIPIPDMDQLAPETVFFDTVYNPIETPMLKSAKEHGYRTIDGVQMFVKQAEAQFEIWTGTTAPEGLFDSMVRKNLST